MPRRTITAAMERRIIMAQMDEGYVGYRGDRLGSAVLLCACGCYMPLFPSTPVIHEHVVPLCMGGADDWPNIRLYRKECAARKTNGPRHLKVDGDISKAAKVKRLRGEVKGRPKRAWPSRRLESRGFEKRART